MQSEEIHNPAFLKNYLRMGRAAFVCLVFLFLAYTYALSLIKPIEYDEAITLLEISGHSTPNWADGIQLAAVHKEKFSGTPPLLNIMRDLREADVHPPLYYIFSWIIGYMFNSDIVLQRVFTMLLVLVTAASLLLGRHASAMAKKRTTIYMFIMVFLSVPTVHYAATFARPYALAMAFLCLGYAATLALCGERSMSKRGPLLATAIGIFCGAAFATNYLALFVGLALAGTALFILIRQRHYLAIGGLIAGGAPFIALSAFFLSAQLGMRSDHAAGFEGPVRLFGELVARLFVTIPDAPVTSKLLNLSAGTLTAGMAGYAAFACVIGERASFGRRSAPILMVIVHLAGLVGLSWWTDKHLVSTRYLSFAGPFLALALACGASSLADRLMLPRARTLLLSLVVLANCAMVLGVLQADAYGGATFARAAQRAAEKPPEESLLLVGAGYGRGAPGAVVMAAAPETRMWIRRMDARLLRDLSTIPEESRYLHVFASPFFPGSDAALSQVEIALVDDGWKMVEREGTYVEFRRNAVESGSDM